MKKLNLLAIAATVLSMNVNAQLKTPAPSPLQTIKQAFALSEISIEYSRPSAKGRVIYGDLVPFGKTWRTGANQATKITFGEDVKVEGNAVPAGTYALYSIPNKEEWEVMLYKDLTLGGNVSDYKASEELVRFKVKPAALTTLTETFTINIANITSTSASIELIWEKTKISFSVIADIDSKIMKNIESALAADTRPYYSAANYYYENGKDLNQASLWVNKAIEQNPKAFWIQLLKAKIELKQGLKKEATASAEKVVILAKEAKNDDYVKMAEKIIADAKK